MLIRFILLLTFTCPYFFNAYSQHFCATDEFRAKNPQTEQLEKALNQQLYDVLKNGAVTAKSVRTVPVVFHIVHQNGPENIPDATILNAISETNLRLQNAAPYSHPTGHDTQIQLCLASVDPYGNPTTGITRTVSPLTVMNAFDTDVNLKNVIRWDPQLYLNVWVVQMLNQPTTAYATLPTPAGNASDGIIFMYMGVNGEILTHELGHYLGLYHTFSQDCVNDNCLLDGDRICDTPPDITNDNTCQGNSCSTDANDTTGLSPFVSDVDEIPNYMDYSSCALSFSQGQADRMNEVLNTVRSTLIQSNGCGQHPGGPVPTASFTHAHSCYTTTFTNTSLNSVGAQWDFDSDGVIDECGNTVTYWSATSGGNYTVTMYAAGYGGVDTVTQQVTIQVPPNPYYPFQWGYTGVYIYDFGSMMFCEDSTILIQGVPGMQSYLWSNGDTTQTTTFQPTEDFVLSLTAIDMNGLSWTPCIPLTVIKAPVPVLSAEPGPFGYCVGDSVTVNAQFGSTMSANAWYYNNSELSDFHDSSYTVILGDTNIFQVYQQHITGCESWSDTLVISAQDCSVLGIEENNISNIIGFPNPTEDKITFNWSNPSEKNSILIFQADGKLVYEKQITEDLLQQLTVDVSQWNPGIYYMQLQNEESRSSIRFIIR